MLTKTITNLIIVATLATSGVACSKSQEEEKETAIQRESKGAYAVDNEGTKEAKNEQAENNGLKPEEPRVKEPAKEPAKEPDFKKFYGFQGVECGAGKFNGYWRSIDTILLSPEIYVCGKEIAIIVKSSSLLYYDNLLYFKAEGTIESDQHCFDKFILSEVRHISDDACIKEENLLFSKQEGFLSSDILFFKKIIGSLMLELKPAGAEQDQLRMIVSYDDYNEFRVKKEYLKILD